MNNTARRFWYFSLCFGMMLCTWGLAQAQPLSGTYTVGGSSPNYTSIESAITDLTTRGVSGPVTFAIRSGTYTPPTGGYALTNVATMSSTNTVTFRPDAGATVVLSGNTGSTNRSGIFTISGGKHYVIEGTRAGGNTKELTIVQTETNYNPAIFLRDDADNNTIKNCVVQSNSSSISSIYGIGTVYIGGTSTTSGNDNNLIENCIIGDGTATYRGYAAVGMEGQSNTYPNTNNIIRGCDIVNFRVYGIYINDHNTTPAIRKNILHLTKAGISATIYGVYVDASAGTAISASIDSNTIYNLYGTSSSSQSVYGIYYNTNNVLSGTEQITNNMISMKKNGYIYYYSIYLSSNTSSASTLTFNVYYNSVYLAGIAESFAQAMPLYRYAYNSSGVGIASTVNHNNNIYYSRRFGGSSTSYGLYVYASPVGGWNSNSNLITLNTNSNYYTAYFNFSLFQTLVSYKTSGQDANSVGGNPIFVDPDNGDLHISTTERTPIEGRAAVLAGFTTDYDGETRNATTPDIGADEGGFLATIAIDAAADYFQVPQANSAIPPSATFTPAAFINNLSATSQTIPIRFKILNSSNTVVYNDLQSFSVPPLSTQRVVFNAAGNVSGSTSLSSGDYTMELSTELGTDGNTTNDGITAPLTVKGALNGDYTIDPEGSGPKNYATIDAAISDLNTLGVSNAVRFLLSDGIYSTANTGYTLGNVPTMNSTNTVTFKPATGATVAITGTTNANTAIFNINGGHHFIFDGSNSDGGTTKDMTIIQTETNTNSTIWLVNNADSNVIKNCNLQGSAGSSTKTSADNGIGILFIGKTTAIDGNDDNLVQNCTIGDPTGTRRNNIGVGVYGTSAKPNRRNKFFGCDIINFGKANTFGYGVVAYAELDGTVIDSCDIHNTVAAPSAITTLYGIYTDYSLGYPINSMFTRNRIYQLTSSAINRTVYGIYHWVSTTSANTLIANNMVSISQDGDHTYYGIYFQSSSGVTKLYHNSVYIGGNATGIRFSYCLYKNAINTINSNNNVFYSDRTGGSGQHYGLYVSSTSGWVSDYNLIEVNPSSTAYTGYYSGDRTTLAALQAASGQDANSIGGNPNYVDPENDNLHINATLPTPIESSGTPLSDVPKDYDNELRNPLAPDIGADEEDFINLVVTAPNGGETWCAGSQRSITWNTSASGNVRIELSSDGGTTFPTEIAASIPASLGTYSWTIPLNQTSGNQYRIRVTSLLNATLTDVSNANFSINTAASLQLGVAPVVLFPANHAMRTITMNATLTDGCSPTYQLQSITSSEADAGTDGSDIANDIQNAVIGTADLNFDLRAERSQGGVGRIYHITYRLSDVNSPSREVTVNVMVPYSMGTIQLGGTSSCGLGFTGMLPNLSGASVDIPFTLTSSGTVQLCIFNSHGKEVSRLINNVGYSAGAYSVAWNGTNTLGRLPGSQLPNGTYIVMLKGCDAADVRLITINR